MGYSRLWLCGYIDINLFFLFFLNYYFLGQERFRCMSKSYCRGATGVIVMYSINDRKSFDNLKYWFKEVRDNTYPKRPFIVLVGNKTDVDYESRAVRFIDFSNHHDLKF